MKEALADFRADRERALLNENEKEIRAIDDKYKELIEKAAEFNLDRLEIENQWEAELNEVRERQRQDQLQAYQEYLAKVKRAGQSDFENELMDLQIFYEALLTQADEFYAADLLSFEEYHELKLELMRAQLQEIADLQNDNNEKIAKDKIRTEEKIAEGEEKLQTARLNNVISGAALLRSVVGDSIGLNISALAFEKLAAVAEIIINAQKESAAYSAAYAGIPFVGPGIAAGLIAQAQVRAGIRVATIAATAVPQFKEALSQPVEQKADGGLVEVIGRQRQKKYKAKPRPDVEDGFLNEPSLILAGEEGPEYFVNATMMDNESVAPVVKGIDDLSNGRIKQADFNALLGAISVSQRADGGLCRR